MSRKLGLKSAVYHGETYLGDLHTVPISPQIESKQFHFPNNQIRIRHISPISERCHPLSILHTISPYSLRCKLEPPSSEAASSADEQPHLLKLHASCFYELKTAVVVLEKEEIHLVAMPSKQKKFPCFWCYSIPTGGLYAYCVGMLNLRCLSIVFDLDETLIVANTMKSFEDRIEALKSWIAREGDPVRASGMSAELKRYSDDRALLKQFTDSDCVVTDGGGKVYKVQLEEVAPLSENHEKVLRPVIRLPDNNVVLTRINPENRDTSVLVRLRPAWEDLRSYLTAKGRKRFEVFVCTMAERDYALEMWRLLDPEAHLINPKQLSNRVVCVKSGSRKSLLNVFQGGICHPNMAMVIDDRLKVWEDKDQPRVHVVPAFTPYYAPQAETANAVPVLCVARNVACNVRGGFFRDFDENMLRKISELFYEDDMSNVPSPPDVSNYLISEETGAVLNGNMQIPISEGISGAEVEQRIPQSDSAMDSDNNAGTNNLDSASENFQKAIPSVSNVVNPLKTAMPSQKGLLAVPAKQDVRIPPGDPPILRLPAQMSQGGLLVEDGSRAHPSPLGHSTAPSTPSIQLSRGRTTEASQGCESQMHNLPSTEVEGTADAAIPQNSAPPNKKETSGDAVKVNALPSSLSISVLQEIGRRCCSKVEFKPILSTSKDLQFSVEVLFTGEKIGVGMGKTRKDAQQQAAQNALHCLADKYLAYVAHSSIADQDDKVSVPIDNGFIWDDVNPQCDEPSSDEKLQNESALLEAAEFPPGSTPAMLQQTSKLANSPRIQPSSYTRRLKEETMRSSQGSSSFRQHRNGHPLP
ncbi:hypothetical protein RND81_06G084900 [Saponaria officinalis]|uniref:protein-serine/threonine phosphatase n=1 Tax=Saponaria officinalis TaxID=3572 RepID=A0AAW1K4V8_SAPOF